MKITTASNGKKVIRIKKSEWERIGEINGWLQEAKKKSKKKKSGDDYDPNPWAVCTVSVGDKAGTRERSEWDEETKERYERCMKNVKKQDKGKKKKDK